MGNRRRSAGKIASETRADPSRRAARLDSRIAGRRPPRTPAPMPMLIPREVTRLKPRARFRSVVEAATAGGKHTAHTAKKRPLRNAKRTSEDGLVVTARSAVEALAPP